MVFALTDSLSQEIINALENQEKQFLVDAKNSSLIEKNDTVKADDENFYEIPNPLRSHIPLKFPSECHFLQTKSASTFLQFAHLSAHYLF